MPSPLQSDLEAIAPGLARGGDGIWRAPIRSTIDYPDEAHAFCFDVELKPPSRLANKVISAFLDREVERIRRRRQMPFGTSCLAVACRS